MSAKSQAMSDPVVVAFINDPRTFWCDMPRRHGIDEQREYWRKGGTDGVTNDDNDRRDP